MKSKDIADKAYMIASGHFLRGQYTRGQLHIDEVAENLTWIYADEDPNDIYNQIDGLAESIYNGYRDLEDME